MPCRIISFRLYTCRLYNELLELVCQEVVNMSLIYYKFYPSHSIFIISLDKIDTQISFLFVFCFSSRLAPNPIISHTLTGFKNCRWQRADFSIKPDQDLGFLAPSSRFHIRHHSGDSGAYLKSCIHH